MAPSTTQASTTPVGAASTPADRACWSSRASMSHPVSSPARSAGRYPFSTRASEELTGLQIVLFGRGIARRTAGLAHRAHAARQPAAVGESMPEQVLDLGIGAAQLVGGPPSQGVVNGRAQPQQDALAFAH